MAAAFSLSGTILGMVIPLANAVEYSVNPIDMAIWGAIALAIQLLGIHPGANFPAPISFDIPASKTASAGFS